MVVGEIGRDRREYLYEMTYCDVLLIIRGYMRRNVLSYQFLRLTAFHSLFSMRENKKGSTPDEIWPCYFDRYKDCKIDENIPTEEEADEMAREIAEINAMNGVFG